MALHIVVVGDPVTGFEFYGPFKMPEYARDWAEEHLDTIDWWVAPLKHEEDIQNGIKEN